MTPRWHRRRGAKGQALLLRDAHAALLRVLESADDELLAAPAAASETAPQELGPHDAFRYSMNNILDVTQLFSMSSTPLS